MNQKLLVFIVLMLVGLLASVGDGSVTGLGLLSPLIPVAAISGHAGLWAHGLSSAALLKLKAAGALAGLFFLSGRGIEFNVGNDNAGWGWGWGGDSTGWGWDRSGRKKRDVEDSWRRLDTPEPSMENVMAYDQLGCGLRFVCELSATPLSQLGNDERLILQLFGQDGKSSKSSIADGKQSYRYASLLGANARDGTRACGRAYSGCPLSRNQIMRFVRRS